MAKRKTVAELESRIKDLEAYQEAVFAMMPNYPILNYGTTIRSGEFSVTLIGLDRASGGIVVRMNDEPCGAIYACDYAAKTAQSPDPYLREISSKIRKAQKEAVERRYA